MKIDRFMKNIIKPIITINILTRLVFTNNLILLKIYNLHRKLF